MTNRFLSMAKLAVLVIVVSLLVCGVSAKTKYRKQGDRIVLPEEENSSTTSSEEDSSSVVGCTTPDGAGGDCKTFVACGLSNFELDDIQASVEGCAEGLVCCPRVSTRSGGESPVRIIPRQQDVAISLPSISINDLDIAGQTAIVKFGTEVEDVERELMKRNLVVQPGTRESFHLAFFGNNPRTRLLSRNGLILLKATEEIVKNFSLTSVQSRTGLSGFRLNATVIQDNCPPEPVCLSTKYRTADGSCNNLANPTWGQAFTAFQRLLPNAYSDGFNLPRIAQDGGTLPSPREVSTRVAVDRDSPIQRFTNMFQQYGQFVDHDITLAAVTRTQNGSGILCCGPEFDANPSLRHRACLQIDIPANDPFYAQFRQTCMNFVRSAPAPRPSCTFGPREQMNQLTSYIDGSQIYGSSSDEEQQLRSSEGGRLRVTTMNGGEYMLQQNMTGGCATSRTTDMPCFRGGDVRVNENSLLTVLQTVWLREHNRVSDELARINPEWTDEILYQEARRVVGAELQHITYNEFLPLLLGRRITAAFHLQPLFDGFLMEYDPSLNAASINAFSAAAYRLGHSMVQGMIELRDRRGQVSSRVPLNTQFNNPELLYQRNNLDRMIRGMTSQQPQGFDSFFTDQLTNHLFEPRGAGFGLDLVSLNIQRGRDHGLPPYNDWREACGQHRLRNFDEMARVMNPEAARAFSQLYRHVDDVDLFIAGVSEFPVSGGVLGPTFACIVAEQFRRYKFGDRFWYENGGMETSFTEAQLNEIRKVSLARVLCDNADDLREIQPEVFIVPTMWNPKLPCNSLQIPRMNLSAWRNEPVWSS